MDDFGAFEMEPEPAPSFGADPEDILELTDDMVADEEPAFEDTMSFEPEPAPQMEMPSYEPEEVMEMDDDESILAPPVQAASSSALAELATAVARERAIALGRGGVTLEEIVREILKALVKEWLDQNLASMTEKMVKKEIDMVAKRAEKK